MSHKFDLEACVPGLADDTHSPAAGLFEDSVLGNSLADHVKPARACVVLMTRNDRFGGNAGRGNRDTDRIIDNRPPLL